MPERVRRLREGDTRQAGGAWAVRRLGLRRTASGSGKRLLRVRPFLPQVVIPQDCAQRHDLTRCSSQGVLRTAPLILVEPPDCVSQVPLHDVHAFDERLHLLVRDVRHRQPPSGYEGHRIMRVRGLRDAPALLRLPPPVRGSAPDADRRAPARRDSSPRGHRQRGQGVGRPDQGNRPPGARSRAPRAAGSRRCISLPVVEEPGRARHQGPRARVASRGGTARRAPETAGRRLASVPPQVGDRAKASPAQGRGGSRRREVHRDAAPLLPAAGREHYA